VFGFSVFLSGLEEIIIDSPRAGSSVLIIVSLHVFLTNSCCADVYMGTIIASCWLAQVFDSLSFVFASSSLMDPEDSPGLPACLAHVLALALESIATLPQCGSKEAAEAAIKTVGVSQQDLSSAVGGADAWIDYLASKAPVTQELFRTL
jgi:hypothetical protein